MSDWPKHADGTNKKIGEMTREESRAVFANACGRLQREFDHPAIQEKLSAILSGKRVDQ